MKDPITTPGKTYAVTSPNGCTVTTEDGLTLAEVEAGKQGYFVAVGGKVQLSDDSAILTQLFKLAPYQKLRLLGVVGGGVPAWKLKYAECRTVDDMLAVNPDYKNDFTKSGLWAYALPNLSNAILAFVDAKALLGFMSDLPIATACDQMFRRSNLKKFKGCLPMLRTAYAMFSYTQITEFDSELPSLQGDCSGMFDRCQLNKASALRVLNSIPAHSTGKHYLAIGIHVDHKTDDEVLAAIANAESRGWTMTVQWNGTPTAQAATTYGLRTPPIYAKVSEHDSERYLEWGHYVTDPSGYEEFRSVEAAREYFGLPDETLTETE